MAGSCTIASPDPPNVECVGHDVLDHVEPERRFDVCGLFREKFLTPEATQEEVVEEVEQPKPSPTEPEEPATPTNPTQFQINTKSIFLPSSSSSMDETTRAVPIHATNELLFSGSCSADQLNEDSNQPRAMFRSGMYAHWWKKERLPPEVLRGIASAYNKRLPSAQASGSKDSSCSLGSLCSSCYCSLGASGFSEGAIYCSICHNCGESTETSTTNTTTTTASTCSNCPVCSADLDSLGGPSVGATAAAALRLSAARDAFAAQTSYSSSLDCPICAARVALATEEGKQTEVRRRATRRLDMLHYSQRSPRFPLPPLPSHQLIQLRVASYQSNQIQSRRHVRGAALLLHVFPFRLIVL